MKPSGKTPFEIRLELLQLSQLILQNKYEAQDEGYKPKIRTSTEEIIIEAEKLNAFVSKANPVH